MIVADLKLTDAANGRAPREIGEDFTLIVKGIKGDAMLGGPAVLDGPGEDRILISNVSVLECELSHAKLRELIDVLPDTFIAIDLAAGHNTGGADH